MSGLAIALALEVSVPMKDLLSFFIFMLHDVPDEEESTYGFPLEQFKLFYKKIRA